MFILCDSYNVILNMSSNTKKLLGLSYKVKKEQEEYIGRKFKIEDLIMQMGFLDQHIEANELSFLPN